MLREAPDLLTQCRRIESCTRSIGALILLELSTKPNES